MFSFCQQKARSSNNSNKEIRTCHRTTRTGRANSRSARLNFVECSRKSSVGVLGASSPPPQNQACAALTVNVPVALMSRELAPTATLKTPACCFHACVATSHVDVSRGRSGKVTTAAPPDGRTAVLTNPLSCSGGSPAAAGKPRYCGAETHVHEAQGQGAQGPRQAPRGQGASTTAVCGRVRARR